MAGLRSSTGPVLVALIISGILQFQGEAISQENTDKHELAVVCRAEWGAAAPRPGLLPHKIRVITIHHSATIQKENQNVRKRIRSFQAWHQNHLRFPDIAYHFLIDRQGIVYQGRDPSFQVDTPTDYKPEGHLSICLIGNFEIQAPDARQVESLVRMISWAMEEYGVSPELVKGHRDYAHTLCPGKQLHKLIHAESWQGTLRKVMTDSPVKLKYSCEARNESVVQPPLQTEKSNPNR